MPYHGRACHCMGMGTATTCFQIKQQKTKGVCVSLHVCRVMGWLGERERERNRKCYRERNMKPSWNAIKNTQQQTTRVDFVLKSSNVSPPKKTIRIYRLDHYRLP